MRRSLFALCFGASFIAAAPALHADDTAIAAMLAVGAEGKGNAEAAAALEKITAAPSPENLLACLAAMDGASPLAANWLRSAAEVVADACAAEDKLPTTALGAYLLDRSHAPKARRFAFELIARASPQTAETLLPGMLYDPSPELRRDAVARLIDRAAALASDGDNDAATLVYRQALGAAVEPHQVKPVAEALAELGVPVDLPKHFGFLMRWHVAGPFDNSERSGFAKTYSPETAEFDPDAVFEAGESEVKWQPLATSDRFGKVDFNKPYGMLKEKLAYAHTVFEAPAARAAELRIGTKNAFKIWLNGALVFARDEYHRGQRIDQYVLPVQLEAGANSILVKSCQNEQTEEWTVQWEFQLRVCDATGAALLAANRQPTPEPENTRARRRPDRKTPKDS